MPARPILQLGDPRLSRKTKLLAVGSPKTKKLVRDLIDTMQTTGLIGIAAPQIGESYRIFVTEVRKTKTRPGNATDKLRVFINPEIVNQSSQKVPLYEGCGSVAEGLVFGPVKRSKAVTVRAFNEAGELFELRCNGLLARVILHEYDHLEGIEFLERMDNIKKLVGREYYEENIRNNPAEQARVAITMKSEKKIDQGVPEAL